jgi:ElaB/YqjD/DUF883 family membrane-anchored ribosome-binding protein
MPQDAESKSGQAAELGAAAVQAAETLYREGREFLAQNEEVTKATGELREAIRRNPLAAVGAAFALGVVFSLLTRG